ncbi:MAG: putative DNA modification/repair radical SAM protein [Rhodospirillales bacterium]
MNISVSDNADPLAAKLAVLADAAKYDASCASSGGERRNSLGGHGIGSTNGMGICHAYAPDGRCISLLKVLLTNFCIYDCAFCINRSSSNTPRARFTTDELVGLTLAFYRRNCIEGLFLSSGIIQSPDYTMEALIDVVRTLREGHDFRGYIHLKAIPNADPALLREAGRHADRLSINIELASAAALQRLAPEKDERAIVGAMGRLRGWIDAAKPDRAARARPPRFAPAGQSTQLIVGADGLDDARLLTRSAGLYRDHGLKRVYYSAFSPIPDASPRLPLQPAPLRREHRLYQADWLMRYYGFDLDEVVAGTDGGMLDLDIDPKLAWALKHRGAFPVDVNRAPREVLLRVPGLGVRAVDRMIASRRHARLTLADVGRLTRALGRARPFIVADGWRPTGLADRASLRPPPPRPRQMALF